MRALSLRRAAPRMRRRGRFSRRIFPPMSVRLLFAARGCCTPPLKSCYRAFVFRRTDGDTETYPEKTTLQRRLKEHLLRGGRMGAALGIRKEETS